MDPPPRVLLSSISRVADKEVQKAIRRLNIRVIAIDEAQVADPDPNAGWGEFLPYKLVAASQHHNIMSTFSNSLWNFLTAACRHSVFLLCTATLSDKALRNIRGECHCLDALLMLALQRVKQSQMQISGSHQIQSSVLKYQ